MSGKPSIPPPVPPTHASDAVPPHGSVTLTEGVRVVVAPAFLPRESDPAGERGQPRWTFRYRVRISNEGPRRVTLLTRHWIIVDADGERHEVRGDGVVGQTPTLEPGAHFEYSSFCPLHTAWGTMEGSYQLVDDDGRSFDARIGRFFLVSEPARA